MYKLSFIYILLILKGERNCVWIAAWYFLRSGEVGDDDMNVRQRGSHDTKEGWRYKEGLKLRPVSRLGVNKPLFTRMK